MKNKLCMGLGSIFVEGGWFLESFNCKWAKCNICIGTFRNLHNETLKFDLEVAYIIGIAINQGSKAVGWQLLQL